MSFSDIYTILCRLSALSQGISQKYYINCLGSAAIFNHIAQ